MTDPNSRRQMQWENLRASLLDGFIAMVDDNSPEGERRWVVEFSEKTKELFGLDDLFESYPWLSQFSWDEDPFDRVSKLRVFVVVLRNAIVGYAILRWHAVIYMILREDRWAKTENQRHLSQPK